jgi:chromosome segregation ATPase
MRAFINKVLCHKSNRVISTQVDTAHLSQELLQIEVVSLQESKERLLTEIVSLEDALRDNTQEIRILKRRNDRLDMRNKVDTKVFYDEKGKDHRAHREEISTIVKEHAELVMENTETIRKKNLEIEAFRKEKFVPQLLADFNAQIEGLEEKRLHEMEQAQCEFKKRMSRLETLLHGASKEYDKVKKTYNLLAWELKDVTATCDSLKMELSHSQITCTSLKTDLSQEQETCTSLKTDLSQEQKTCPICLDGFVEGKVEVLLRCGHVFHLECCQGWPTCASCRTTRIIGPRIYDHFTRSNV